MASAITYERKKQSVVKLRDTVVVITALLKEADPQFNLLTEFGPAQAAELTVIDQEASGWLASHRDIPDDRALIRTIWKANEQGKDKPINPARLYQALKGKIATLGDRDRRLTDALIELFGP